jgi:hypothetical protein
MKINEIKITKYFEVKEGVITQIQKDFLSKSEDYIDELLTFGESINALIEWGTWSDEDLELVSFFEDIVIEIDECMLSVEDNSSLVKKSIPSELQLNAITKHRLIVLMYVGGCFSVLQEASK